MYRKWNYVFIIIGHTQVSSAAISVLCSFASFIHDPVPTAKANYVFIRIQT